MPWACPGRLRTAADRCGGSILLLGWAALAAYNALKWRQDRALALRRVAQVQPRPALVESRRVSILVAAWNEAAMIERHIESVLALRYPELEYVLCSGGPDGTYELAKRHEQPGVIVLEQRPGEGKQAALRRCLERATGEIVFLTDADCLLDDDGFERTISPLVNEAEVAATGHSRPLPGDGATSALVTLQHCREVYLALRSGAYSPGLLGRNCAIRRDVLAEVGGFAAEARTGTDYHLGRAIIQAGYRIRNVATSTIATQYPSRPLPYLRQQARWVRNLFVHGAGTRDWGQLRAAVSAVVAGFAVTLGPLFAVPLGRSGLAAWTSVVGFALLARLRHVAAAKLLLRGDGAPATIIWIPAWLLLDALLWASIPVQLLSRRWRNRW